MENSEAILITGSNTTEAHPVIANVIKKGVVKNGTKVIVIDPRKIGMVRYSTKWLRQNNGTDVAVMNGLMNVIIAEGLEDKKFIEERTEGYEELKKMVAKFTPEKVEEITGIPAQEIIETARIFANAKTASIIYAMGITQHAHGTDNVKSIANLAMLTGNLGKESTGVNPLRGQNNVQGACDMGGLPNVYPGYQKVIDENARLKFEKAWNTKLSENNGLTIVEMMNAAIDGKLKALYVMGENPIVSDPNLNHVDEALKALDLLIVQDIFLTETAEMADVVLPAAAFAEKDGTVTNSERRILPVRQFLCPMGDARPDWQIIQSIAQGMGYFWFYSSEKQILDEINTLTPQYGGITFERVQAGEKLQWPCPTITHEGTKYLHKGAFARGLGLFSAIDYIPPKEPVDAEYPFVLSTGRMINHYHTATMTRRSVPLNNLTPDSYIEMHKGDIKKLGLENGSKVKVSSRRGEIETFVLESGKVAKGSTFMPFHFAEAAVNKLTLDDLDPVAKIPELKVCAVKIEKA